MSRFPSREELEDGIRDEYQEKINQLEEEAVELLKEIDALKHEVDVAEAETEREWLKKQKWKKVFSNYHSLRKIIEREYPGVIESAMVIKRLEGTT